MCAICIVWMNLFEWIPVTFQKIQTHPDVYQFQRKIWFRFEKIFGLFLRISTYSNILFPVMLKTYIMCCHRKLKILSLSMCVRVCGLSLHPNQISAWDYTSFNFPLVLQGIFFWHSSFYWLKMFADEKKIFMNCFEKFHEQIVINTMCFY